MIKAIKCLTFSRKTFGGSSEDIERSLQKSHGAIFLIKIGEEPYDPEREGEKLFRVLRALFPKPTLDALSKKLCEQPAGPEEQAEVPPPKFGAIPNI